MHKKYCQFIFLLVVLTFSNTVLAQSNENTLYGSVIEQVGDPAGALTDAKVTLAYGPLGGEQSLPATWQDVPVNEAGQAIFSNVQPGVYAITAKAFGYISSQKEFTKQAGRTDYTSIALTKAPEGATGSIKIAILKMFASQTKEYIRNGQIQILKDGEFIRSSGTESGEVLFTDLPIGTYIASASAPGYNSEQIDFEVEANVEGWLPIGLEEAGGKPRYTTCPKDCTCDEQTNIISCSGQGFGGKSISISTSEAVEIVIDQNLVDEVIDVEVIEDEDSVKYGVGGTKNEGLLFVIPVKVSTNVQVDATTGKVISINRPWWSFLAW